MSIQLSSVKLNSHILQGSVAADLRWCTLECISENIIEIVCYLPKLSLKKLRAFYFDSQFMHIGDGILSVVWF